MRYIFFTLLAIILSNFTQAFGQDSLQGGVFSTDVWEAIDRRDATAMELGDLPKMQRHIALGMIGGDEACDQIKADMRAAKRADAVSAGSLALCGREIDRGFLADAISAKPDDWRRYRSVAPQLGLIGGKDMQRFLVDLLNRSLALSESLGIAAQAAGLRANIDGLMQALVYDRLDISQLPNLPVKRLLDLTKLGSISKGVDFSAAYLLGRLRGLQAKISAAELFAAIQAVPGTQKSENRARVVAALMGSLARYEALSPEMLTYAIEAVASDHPRIKVAAYRLLGAADKDAEANAEIITGIWARIRGQLIDDQAPPSLKVAAIGAALRYDADAAAEILPDLLHVPSPWVRKTAVDALVDFDEPLAESTAAGWLSGDLYLASAAITLLSGSETGKKILATWAAENADTVRAKRILARLKSDTEVRDRAKTPDYASAKAAGGQSVLLTTSRGPITIKMNAGTPFAARNFVKLVNQGLMDDGIFHRVISNFVAQWGESEREELKNWPMVRDNWLSGTHAFGSVGVATIGKDTGGVQFFINTHDNLHLTGRYTVVGYVTTGMDAAVALEEGDKLISAKVIFD